jgi:hypothetical protein
MVSAAQSEAIKKLSIFSERAKKKEFFTKLRAHPEEFETSRHNK